MSLPDNPNLDWLRKQAKRRLEELQQANPAAQLADAQFDLAKQHGFPSWRALKAHIDSLTIDGQLFEAARNGDVSVLTTLLDTHPEKLHVRMKPYDWTLLHIAASRGRLEAVDLLLGRGLDVNVRETGDNSYPMHWAAGAGHLEVVRRLADAGGDVVGQGDDHELEVIGWATCWEEDHDDVATFLISRGARHHIFSAIAMNLADEVRRIVAANPSALHKRMSRNENHRMPLHLAVLRGNRAMVELLLELSADPLSVDGSGFSAVAYASSPEIDRPIMQKIRDMTASELLSAERGHRPVRAEAMDLIASLAFGDWDIAERLLRENPHLIEPDGPTGGALHVMAKRNDVAAVRWLVEHGADPNGRWGHWDSDVTPLHLAARGGHAEIVRVLLAAGADPRIRDSKHDGDAIGWAEYFRQPAVVEILKAQAG